MGYYPEDKTQVMADASSVGLGAILVQINSKSPRIIAYPYSIETFKKDFRNISTKLPEIFQMYF